MNHTSSNEVTAERDRMRTALASSPERPPVENWVCPKCGSGIHVSVQSDGSAGSFGCEGDQAKDFCEFEWSFPIREFQPWHQEFMEEDEWID